MSARTEGLVHVSKILPGILRSLDDPRANAAASAMERGEDPRLALARYDRMRAAIEAAGDSQPMAMVRAA